MIRALGFTVEYGRGSFNKEHTSGEVRGIPTRMLLDANGVEPALSASVAGHESTHGVVVSLELFVVVADDENAEANVLAFLDRFEAKLRPELVTREFRIVDGVPSTQARSAA